VDSSGTIDVSRHPVRPRRPQGGFGGSPPDSPRFCPLLPQKSSNSGKRHTPSSSSCLLRSCPLQPEILPAFAAEKQLPSLAGWTRISLFREQAQKRWSRTSTWFVFA
jgi:hypothetical protein